MARMKDLDGSLSIAHPKRKPGVWWVLLNVFYSGTKRRRLSRDELCDRLRGIQIAQWLETESDKSAMRTFMRKLRRTPDCALFRFRRGLVMP